MSSDAKAIGGAYQLSVNYAAGKKSLSSRKVFVVCRRM